MGGGGSGPRIEGLPDFAGAKSLGNGMNPGVRPPGSHTWMLPAWVIPFLIPPIYLAPIASFLPKKKRPPTSARRTFLQRETQPAPGGDDRNEAPSIQWTHRKPFSLGLRIVFEHHQKETQPKRQYLDPQTTHKNWRSPTIIVGVFDPFLSWNFEGSGI